MGIKRIHPLHIVLYILAVFFFLGLYALVIPPEGWRLGNWEITFVRPGQLHHASSDTLSREKVESILAAVDTSMTPGTAGAMAVQTDTGQIAKPAAKDTVRKQAETVRLVYDSTGRKHLHRFFRTLQQNKGRISILHYGDSQIESDRITGFIREKFQSLFGGYGPGLIPATEVYYMYAFRQHYSDNWTRYVAFGQGNRLRSRKYGAMGSASRFTPEYARVDSLMLDSLPVSEAWIRIRPSLKAYGRARRYSEVKMHYNDCVAPVELTVKEGEKTVLTTSLRTDGKQHAVRLHFNHTPQDLTFRFKGKVSPNVCGFSLEGTRGVQVSNIALRGSDGAIFTRIRFSTLSGMMKEENTQMVIMQFGGNAVVVFRDSAHVRKYAGWFQKQIYRVRKAMPGSTVLVIGPSDMSQTVKGEHHTYPLLPYAVEQMEKASVEAGASFWNLYEAMGGENAMPVWVEKQLAAKDYVHFTGKGAKFAAQLFWNALWKDYEEWKEANR